MTCDVSHLVCNTCTTAASPAPLSATDVSYNQVSDPTFGPGKVSSGFYYAASTIWQSGLGTAVMSEIDAGCRSITVAGYSLGGAVAQLLAVKIEVSSTAPCAAFWLAGTCAVQFSQLQ